jgi:hypothetical protein
MFSVLSWRRPGSAFYWKALTLPTSTITGFAGTNVQLLYANSFEKGSRIDLVSKRVKLSITETPEQDN